MLKWLIAAALALLLSLDCAKGDDVLYPWPVKDPQPPLSTIDEVERADESASPSCIPANEDCDDPEEEMYAARTSS